MGVVVTPTRIHSKRARNALYSVNITVGCLDMQVQRIYERYARNICDSVALDMTVDDVISCESAA